MGIGLLLTISLWMPAARSQPLTFAGVWVLDGPRSDFGVATAPEQLVLRVQAADQSLVVVEIKTDRQKRQVSYRQIKLDEKSCRAGDDAVLPRSGCRVETAGFTNIEEYWQLSEFGELVIQRQVRHEGQPVLQYLVLERATGLVD